MTSIAGREIRFFYDFVCPYAYLASTQIEAVAAAAGGYVTYQPMLLGGVFRAIGAPDSPPMPPSKARLNDLDMERWAKRLGVPLVRPEGHPRRTVLALRAALATSDLRAATKALFGAYFRDGQDLEDPKVVAGALDGAGLDGAAAVDAAGTQAMKDELRHRTDEAVALGIFGAPTCVVGGELFWGQDRLDFVRHAVTREPWPPPPEHLVRSSATLSFYFDFSSPYAYLASTQVRALAARTGATLVYRPILLGALFKSIGTPNVPLFAMSTPKQSYMAHELDRWSKRWGVPFVFSSRFPIQTVRPLRLVSSVPEAQRADLVDALFRAAWVRDRDLGDEAVLRDALGEAGCDADAALAASTSDEAKSVLREATASAEALGVCGVPSFLVVPAGASAGDLYWGQDRLGLVEDALVAT